jgi:hypothetical protein
MTAAVLLSDLSTPGQFDGYQMIPADADPH